MKKMKNIMKNIRSKQTEKNAFLWMWTEFLVCKNFDKIKEELNIDELLRLRMHLLGGELTLNYGLLDGSYRLRNKNERSCSGYVFNPAYMDGYFNLKELLLDDMFLTARGHRVYDLKEEDIYDKYQGYSCNDENYELNGKITVLEALEKDFEEKYEKPLKDLDYYLPEDLQHKDLQKQQMGKIKDILFYGLDKKR
jgi:hypothetical protein